MTRIESEIREFLSESFLFGKASESLPADESLLDMGVIDSTGVLDLASFFEERFGLEVVDEDFVPDNFETVGQMVAFVQRKIDELEREDERDVA